MDSVGGSFAFECFEVPGRTSPLCSSATWLTVLPVFWLLGRPHSLLTLAVSVSFCMFLLNLWLTKCGLQLLWLIIC